jgi:hypothetical protein
MEVMVMRFPLLFSTVLLASGVHLACALSPDSPLRRASTSTAALTADGGALVPIGDVSLDDQALPADVVRGKLGELFEGKSQLVEDTSFVPPVIDGHSETSTVYFNGQYHMYFRAFHYVNPATGGIVENPGGHITGIGLALSDDGNTFTAQNYGLPLPTLASNPQPPQTSPDGLFFYAPSVIVDNGALVTTYDIGGPLSLEGIGLAQSSDGLSWTPPTSSTPPNYIIHDDHSIEAVGLGISDLFLWNGEYNLTFCAAETGASLTRRWTTSATLDGFTQGQQVMQGEPSPGWMSVGPGRASIIHDTDGYFYNVFEGFKTTAYCGQDTTTIGLGLARSTDLINWEYSPVNPLRLQRLGKSCGDGDMPAWQLIAGQAPMVVATNIHYPNGGHMTVRRFKIDSAPVAFTSSPIVAMGVTPAGDGYWEVASNGGVFTYGAAKYHGSVPGLCSTDPSACSVDNIVAMAVSPSGDGYWLVGRDGGIFAFGDAKYYGSLPGSHIVPAKPIVAIAATPSGGGYWLIGADGGVFTFGNAHYRGSLPGSGIVPNAPIVGIARTLSGEGYWLVGGDGGVFTYGDACYLGSLPAENISVNNIIAVAATADVGGLLLAASDGNVYTLGGAQFFGSTGGYEPFSHFRITGLAALGAGGGTGYYMVAQDGGIISLGSAVFLGWVRGPGWNG